MAHKGSGLAARLRAAVERDEVHRDAEEQERLRQQEVARRARVALFDDLVAFGSELGFAEVARGPHGDPPVEAVTFRRGEHWLRFAAPASAESTEDPADPAEESSSDPAANGVVVDFGTREKGAVHRLYREAVLEDRWIWVRRRRTREDRLPLFDQGLELLLVHALELPSPGAPPGAPPADQRSEPVARPSTPGGTGDDPSADPDVPDVPAPQKRSL